jgi:uncharacterized membrane protein YeiH
MNPLTLTTAQYLIESVGIAAFAISGVIEAARRKLDIVGVCVVAGLAAFGGGTLRDILLDRRPFFWVEHQEQLWFVVALALVSTSFLRAKHFEPTERAMQWPDAIGMGLFAAGGAQIALSMNTPALVTAIMGMITAVFGGVLRDIVCNDIPKVFSDHRPYAICAFAGGWVLVAADFFGAPQWACLLLAAGTASLLRILAIQLDWQIPPWKTD